LVNIQDLYDSRVRPMSPAERLQLARLILDDLAPTPNSGGVADVSDDWSDDHMAEVAAHSLRRAEQSQSADAPGRP
jgi:hypothetical protein